MSSAITSSITSDRSLGGRGTQLVRLLSALFGAAVLLLRPAEAQRPFTRAFTANLHGRMVVAGNSVVTCDRTRASAATCNTVENGEAGPRTLRNDNVPTAWIDVDGNADLDGNGSDDTFNSSRADAAFTGQVEWAGLYWWGSVDAVESTRQVPVAGRGQVLVKSPTGGAYQVVNAARAIDGTDPYSAFADVTALVRAGGAGSYTVANVTAFTGTDDHLGGWALVVVERNNALPLRHISLYDGYATYGNGVDVPITFSGFLTPLVGPLDAQLALITLDGDGGTSDSFTFKATRIFNALNPITDVANSTISAGGAAVTTRQPAFANTLGTDVDQFDVSTLLANGDTSVTTHFDGASNEQNFAVFAGFQTTLYQPDVSVELTVTDLDGGELKAGDVLEYTATITNRADARDGAVKVVFSDAIPMHTTYVPGSLLVASGPAGAATGALTDAAGDDTGEFDGSKVTMRVGSGATATTGGGLSPGQTTVIRFRVRINPLLAQESAISNQALVTFEGQTLSTTTTSTVFTVMSGVGGTPGPTTTPVVKPLDSDGDGLTDVREMQIGSNPNDADTDDDGVIDGGEPGYDLDFDNDGKLNVLDPDSDNDGLFDGTELGLGCGHPATDVSKGFCVADADAGATTTDPRRADTDSGGKPDGIEDMNHNGRIDGSETDPNNPADDNRVPDTDGDGLPDPVEGMIGSNPNDADSDDDGSLDGAELEPAADSDGDGKINVLDPDSDNDGIFDGTEQGQGCGLTGTDLSKGFCVADADAGSTKTDPRKADTDGGGKPDGVEDANKNGRIDAGETDPNNPADDNVVVDTDGDGLPDPVEGMIGSNPNDADSDDDGVRDGAEVDPGLDTDGDGKVNVLDPDSDNDGLGDGTEVGNQCTDPATDRSRNLCIPDADMGATKTNPVKADTDGGGASDGAEDTDHDGVVDAGERNPLDPSDDVPPVMPMDAGTGSPDVGTGTGGTGGTGGADGGADAGVDGASGAIDSATGSNTEFEVNPGTGTDAADGGSGLDTGIGSSNLDAGALTDAPSSDAGAAGGAGGSAGAGSGGSSGSGTDAMAAGDAGGAAGAGGGNRFLDGRIAGGGCSCDVGTRNDASSAGGGLVGMLMLAALLRRRRRAGSSSSSSSAREAGL